MSNFTTANVYLQTNQWFPCKLRMTTDGLQGTKEITKKFLMGHLSDFIQQHPETSWGIHIFPSDRKFTVHTPHRNMVITHRIEVDR